MRYKYKQKVKVNSKYYGEFYGVIIDYNIFSSALTSSLYYNYLISFVINGVQLSEWFDESQVTELFTIKDDINKKEWLTMHNFQSLCI